VGLLLWPAWTVVVRLAAKGMRSFAKIAGSRSVVTMSTAVRAPHMWPEGKCAASDSRRLTVTSASQGTDLVHLGGAVGSTIRVKNVMEPDRRQ
jgi:hypothetical protein